MNFFCFITLILCLFKVSKATESVDISRDFKTLLMYFSEAFLNGAVFDGRPLEGDSPIDVAEAFVEAIGNVESEYSQMPELDNLIRFKTQLAAGIPIAQYILSFRIEVAYNSMSNDAVTAQEMFIAALRNFGGVVMPTGWVGHTMYLVMRKGEKKGTVDFAFVNTGQGVQYHHHSADPNGVFPRLTQIWMEFKNVDEGEIFTNEAWFFYGLIALKNKIFEERLKSLFTPYKEPLYPDYFPEYFYGSFLANFKENLVPPRADRLAPMQRSGSCTLSSLIGALLYTSRTEETFYFHRLKIGHALVKSFLAKAQVNERFKTIIMDGFETNGRNFLKVIASSLAQKTLEYLEFALPEHFKHAGLIGKERFKWMFEKKQAANEALMEEKNVVVLESIKTSIQLINDMMDFIKDNPISMVSNDIVLTEEAKSKFKPLRPKNIASGSNHNASGKKLSKDFYSFLDGECDRLDESFLFRSFDEFYEAIKKFNEPKNAQVFYHILNIFVRTPNLLQWDKWLESATDQQLLDLQTICKTLAYGFATCSEKFLSFDDIVLLGYLQKLAWKFAVTYDNRLPDERKIGLGHLAAPRTIQSVLFGFQPISTGGKVVNIFAGNLKQFIIHNCFDQRNVEIFMDLFKEDEAENGKPIFMGPESFCDINEGKFKPIIPFGVNGELYYKMMKHPGVESIWERLKGDGHHANKWKSFDPEHGKFIIVFSKGQSELFQYFQHYYNLMDTLALVRAGSMGNCSSNSKSWTSADISPCEVNQTFTIHVFSVEYFENSYLEIIKKQNYFFSVRNNFSNYLKHENCFFKARHSLALTRSIDITSLETWFNYIKSSASAKLFDSTYFQYITDHVLNVPKFDVHQIVMFPVDRLMARLIIEELSRLIRISLEIIITKNHQISIEKRRTLIIRSVNVSVVLTRFISRIESLKILNGSECAISLARIYNLFIPFASFKTDYLLNEQEISRINFALAHICSVPIRNALTFMNNVHLGTTQKGLRRTLKRYHWFAARKGYVFSGVGTSVADDQFNYGTSESPLTPEETGFLKELLIAYFLPGLMNDPSIGKSADFTLSYNYELYLVKIQHPAKGLEIIINLWTGATVFNGWCIVNGNVFINSEPFQNFFAPEDRSLVSNGIAAEVAGMSVYALPDFKGSSYLISREVKRSKIVETKINRKWNGNWYELTTIKDLNDSFKELGLEYDWIQNYSWIFKRSFDQKSCEIIIIGKNELNPVMRFIADENAATMKVEVDGLSEKTNLTVLSRREERTIRSTFSFSSTSTNEPLRNYLFQRHFDSFTRGTYILAKDELGQFVVICMNLRFPEDMRRPIVLREKPKENDGTMAIDFKILNLSNVDVCSNQSLGGGSSLPGGLVIISDSKKALLLPNALKSEDKKNTVQVERIPLSDDNLAPQTREHKLLLAYYLISQFEFDSARKLLNPSSSIHHNEAFSVKELKILKWITEIKLEAPEALALKLFAYLHYAVNRKKFSFDHTKNSLPEVSAPATLFYLFALREMSEKYYIFFLFPEVMEETLFRKLFAGSLTNTSTPPDPTLDSYGVPSIYISFYERNDTASYQIGTRFYSSFFELIFDGKDDQIKLASRLNLRRDHKTAFTIDNEIAVFCYLNEFGLWTEFKTKLLALKGTKDTAERMKIVDESKKIYEEAMATCIPKYKHLFTGMNQSSGMTMTSLETLKATFEAETSRLRLNVVNQKPNQVPLPELVSKIDFDTISAAEAKLRDRLILGNENCISFGFNAETMENSSVLKKLQKSIDDFVKETAQSYQSEINFGNDDWILKDLKTFCSNRFNDLSSAQVTDITELSTSLNAEICSSAIGSILSLMHQKKAKTFESLYACYLRDSLVCIQKKFPQLTLEQCIQVKEQAKVFYSRQVLINHYELLKEKIESFLISAISSDELNILCDELSKIYDFNERMKDPVIMNFEFRSQKYRLKPEQVKDVRLLSTADQSTKLFPSVVIQRMMAAGKTLVLGTISVVKKALNSKQLSILVPPSSLYQSSTTSMQANTYKYFKKKGINFTFPRFGINLNETPDSTANLTNYLKTVRELIISTMNDSNYMILSPDTLHSFLNSYIEALLNAISNWNVKYQDILKSYAQIYRIFKQRGSIILDEIDMTMDPKKELNFPTQETEPYNMTAVAMLTDIMEFMIFDEDIIEAGLHIHSNNQASLTAKNYEICIKLVLEYIRSQLKKDSSLWYYLVYGSKPHVASVDDIMEFLGDRDMAGGKEWITIFHDSGNEVLADALIIVKNQLHYQMEHALKGTVNLNFGSARSLRPEIKFAVPYAAANTPSAASVFADRWETLLKTLLMVSASPCSAEIAKEFIEYAGIAIPSESAITKSTETTVTYRNMKLILPTDMCPMNLDGKNILHVQAMQAALSTRSPAAIRLLFTFYITQVFDKMTFPTEQITSNALNVTSMFNSVQGYSGTIDNINILPQHVVKDAYEDNLKNEKNNGGISLKLVRDCDDDVVKELNEEVFTKSAEEMVKELMSLYPSESVSAIIDTGAFFKNFKNIQVARAILSVYKDFKAVLYYDEDSNQLNFIRSASILEKPGILETSDPEYIRRVTEVEMEERFTFYDQRHITGSDILQPKTAHAIMTIGPRVLLRDILQGALRMRQFMTSQKVHLVTTKASRKFYESKIRKDAGNKDIESTTDHKIDEVEVKLENNEMIEEPAETKELVEKQELAEVKGANKEVEEAIGEWDKVESADIKIKIEETKMKVSDVLTLGALNEDEKQEHENVKLAFGKINAEIRAFILNEVSRALVENSIENIREYILDMVKCGKPLFLRSIKEVPLNLLQKSKHENTTSVLKLFAISQLHSLTEVMNKFSSNAELRKRFNSMKKGIKYMISLDNAKYYFDKKTICTPINLDNGSEVQQQTLTLTMLDLNLETIMEKNSRSVEYVHNYSLLPNLKTFEDQEVLNSQTDVYVRLNDLYNVNCSNELFKPYLDNVLVTFGDRVGVTQDLIMIAQLSYTRKADKDYPIFSEFTFEGSHILVQLNGVNIKVLLISSKHASSVLKELDPSSLKDFNPSKFWLCDLSGSVTATNDAETETGQNILDFIPKIDNLIFDLLIFNGSLPQILGNSKLKTIYENWLKSENFEKRAIFLRLRMRALMSKEAEMFEIDDENLGLLKKYSLGIQNNAADNIVDGYPKRAIEENLETEKMKMLNISSHSQQKSGIGKQSPINFDFDLEIKNLLKINGEEESKSTSPAFIIGPEDITALDINNDESPIPVITILKREKIDIPNYAMSEKKIYQDVDKQEEVIKILGNEIEIDESGDENNEPPLNDADNPKGTEITVDISLRSGLFEDPDIVPPPLPSFDGDEQNST